MVYTQKVINRLKNIQKLRQISRLKLGILINPNPNFRRLLVNYVYVTPYFALQEALTRAAKTSQLRQHLTKDTDHESLTSFDGLRY